MCMLSVFYSMKMRYDESDNILVRTSRVVTDRVEDAFSESKCQSLITPKCCHGKHSWSDDSI